MKLEGLGAVLWLMALGVYALLVGVLLLFRLFRWRAMALANATLTAVWLGLGLMDGREFGKLAIDLNRALGNELAVLLVLLVLLVIAFVLLAPFVQYRNTRTRFEA